LFLEKAPKDVFTSAPVPTTAPAVQDLAKSKISTADLLHEAPTPDSLQTSTLFVSNLNFITTTEQLRQTFAPLAGLTSARVKTKPNPKRPGQLLSMGIGFLEFGSKADAQAAMAAMDGHVLDGHRLNIRPSQRVIDAGEERRKDDRAKASAGTKIIIKNLPFETDKKDVRRLFGAYGELRSVRVPKKFDSSARGFAFAEFKTAREAASAMAALRDTHLLGRRLNLEYAAADSVDAEEEIEKMQKKVRSQVNKVAMQKLTGAGRRKFNVSGNDQEEN
jgi:multiple RNA-binding domain-containing protein 1